MLKRSAGPFVKQQIATGYKGYEGWDVYAVRSKHGNMCLAVVGEVDRGTDDVNAGNAALFTASSCLLAEAEANLQMLTDLRDKHLSHTAAVVRALVQKRIEAIQAVIAAAKGEQP